MTLRVLPLLAVTFVLAICPARPAMAAPENDDVKALQGRVERCSRGVLAGV